MQALSNSAPTFDADRRLFLPTVNVYLYRTNDISERMCALGPSPEHALLPRSSSQERRIVIQVRHTGLGTRSCRFPSKHTLMLLQTLNGKTELTHSTE